MSPPPLTVDPFDRDRGPVPKADSYARDDKVWVYRHDDQGWHPGKVRGSSVISVVVEYQPVGGRGGKVTDTVMPVYVMPRTEDPS